MFEFEIMLTGYTLIVATTTVVISKFVSKKQLKKITKELSELKTESQRLNLEINKLHKLLKQ
jgi:hypothetical protein